MEKFQEFTNKTTNISDEIMKYIIHVFYQNIFFIVSDAFELIYLILLVNRYDP